MRTARISQRFVGYLVDGVILSIAGTSALRLLGPEAVWRWGSVGLAGIYTVGFIASNGQTIGKRLAGTQVVDEFDRRPRPRSHSELGRFAGRRGQQTARERRAHRWRWGVTA
jgi:uncharacterized RDD family membrane protein YckC